MMNSTSRPFKDMRPSPNTSLLCPATSIFRSRMQSHRSTPSEKGHASVTPQLLVVRCTVDLQSNNDGTTLQRAEHHGHSGIVLDSYSVELDDVSSSFMIKPCNLIPTNNTLDPRFRTTLHTVTPTVCSVVLSFGSSLLFNMSRHYKSLLIQGPKSDRMIVSNTYKLQIGGQ